MSTVEAGGGERAEAFRFPCPWSSFVVAVVAAAVVAAAVVAAVTAPEPSGEKTETTHPSQEPYGWDSMAFHWTSTASPGEREKEDEEGGVGSLPPLPLPPLPPPPPPSSCCERSGPGPGATAPIADASPDATPLKGSAEALPDYGGGAAAAAAAAQQAADARSISSTDLTRAFVFGFINSVATIPALVAYAAIVFKVRQQP